MAVLKRISVVVRLEIGALTTSVHVTNPSAFGSPSFVSVRVIDTWQYKYAGSEMVGVTRKDVFGSSKVAVGDRKVGITIKAIHGS